MTSDVDAAAAAARAGAEVAIASYRRDVERHRKDGIDFATDADLGAERAVRELLGELRPGDAVVGEEYGGAGDGERTWLVDPICGTLNYAAGLPLFAVNVALRERGEVRVAAVADPVAGEVLLTDGTAAWSAEAPESPFAPDGRNRLVEVELHRRASRVLRLLGAPAFHDSWAARGVSTSLGLAWVAAGRLAAYVSEQDVHDSVHYAAGLALCRGAGCVVTDLDGGPVTSGRGLVAADRRTHERLLELFAAD